MDANRRPIIPLLLAACVLAGEYGAAHDQISYTVSPEYYKAFKFHQFHVPPRWQGRTGAAIVGWRASWWMGVVIGIPIVLCGLVFPDRKTYIRSTLMAFGIVTVTTLVAGLAALAYATLAITDASLGPVVARPGVHDPVAFARAGTMHNFSYLGGLVGILTGIVYLLVERIRVGRRAQR